MAVTFKRVIGAVMMVGMLASNLFAGEAADDKTLAGQSGKALELASALPMSVVTRTPAKRPATLSALYGLLGATEAWDLYSTSKAIKAGAREANPTVAPFSRNVGAMIGLKAATSAAVILCTERMWRKNRAGAIVLMAVVNGAMAGVAMHNLQNARVLAQR
jgi:hypothetical protein